MATKRNFEFKLLSYNDATESNNPSEIIFDNTETFSDDLGDDVLTKIVNVPASSTDLSIPLNASAVRVLFIKNLNASLMIEIKLNGTGDTAHKIAPGKIFYLESALTHGNQSELAIHN